MAPGGNPVPAPGSSVALELEVLALLELVLERLEVDEVTCVVVVVVCSVLKVLAVEIPVELVADAELCPCLSSANSRFSDRHDCPRQLKLSHTPATMRESHVLPPNTSLKLKGQPQLHPAPSP